MLHDLSYSHLNDEIDQGNFSCGRCNCQICNVLKPDREFKSIVTGAMYEIIFHFDCKSLSMVYLITYKV